MVWTIDFQFISRHNQVRQAKKNQMDAKKIIESAIFGAEIQQAQHMLDQTGEAFRIIAELRFKFFKAHLDAGFDEKDALLLTINCMDGM